MERNTSRHAMIAQENRRLASLRAQLARTEALIVLRTRDHYRIDGEIFMLRLRIIDLKGEDRALAANLEDRIGWLECHRKANNSAAGYQGVISKDIRWEILGIEEKMKKDGFLSGL